MGNYCAYHVRDTIEVNAAERDRLVIRAVDFYGGGRWITRKDNPNTVVCLNHGGGCTVIFTHQPKGLRLPSSQATFFTEGEGYAADQFRFPDGTTMRLLDLPIGVEMEVISVGPIKDEIRVPAVPIQGSSRPQSALSRLRSLVGA